jgi:hypothetical protein
MNIFQNWIEYVQWLKERKFDKNNYFDINVFLSSYNIKEKNYIIKQCDFLKVQENS